MILHVVDIVVILLAELVIEDVNNLFLPTFVLLDFSHPWEKGWSAVAVFKRPSSLVARRLFLNRRSLVFSRVWL